MSNTDNHANPAFESPQTAACRFRIKGRLRSLEPYGNGHINDTYLFRTEEGETIHSYILQRINHQVFRQPKELMENIRLVTSWLARQIEENGGNPARETLTLVPLPSGQVLYKDPLGGYWRCYLFIEQALCLEQVRTADEFRESGIAFGKFQKMLSGFPARSLSEPIPDFHNTPLRYQRLLQAVQNNPLGRAESVLPELQFLADRAGELNSALALLEDGRLPLRVTHNDTKLNNVLLDASTRKALCVIDLDTIMPGLSINDFGDSIRFGANTALEDEEDPAKVSLSLPLYQAFTDGFLEGAGQILTGLEIAMLPMGAKLMTLECGIRFLTDYLEGDTYFKIHRPSHNLDRARVQLALVKDMENKWDAMTSAVR